MRGLIVTVMGGVWMFGCWIAPWFGIYLIGRPSLALSMLDSYESHSTEIMDEIPIKVQMAARGDLVVEQMKKFCEILSKLKIDKDSPWISLSETCQRVRVNLAEMAPKWDAFRTPETHQNDKNEVPRQAAQELQSIIFLVRQNLVELGGLTNKVRETENYLSGDPLDDESKGRETIRQLGVLEAMLSDHLETVYRQVSDSNHGSTQRYKYPENKKSKDSNESHQSDTASHQSMKPVESACHSSTVSAHAPYNDNNRPLNAMVARGNYFNSPAGAKNNPHEPQPTLLPPTAPNPPPILRNGYPDAPQKYPFAGQSENTGNNRQNGEMSWKPPQNDERYHQRSGASRSSAGDQSPPAKTVNLRLLRSNRE